MYELFCLCLFWFVNHSLTHSLTHLLTHSLTHLLTYSLTYSLTHLLTHSLTHRCWFVYLLSHVGSCAQIVSFVLVSHALTFILHIQINLSHYSMEIVNSFKHSEPFILQVHLLTPYLLTYLLTHLLTHLFSNCVRRRILSARNGWTGFTEDCSSKQFIIYSQEFLDIICVVCKGK